MVRNFFMVKFPEFLGSPTYVILGASVCSECQPTENTCKILFVDKFIIPVKHYLSVMK